MIRMLRHFGPRLIRLQFSLASLFLLTTAAASGTWYWYQRPYPVERWVGSLYPICTYGLTQPLPNNYREVQYYRRVRGDEPIEHGRYLGYDAQGNLLRTGYYRNGNAHGDFVDYSATGRKLRQSTLVNGQTQGVCHEWDLAGNLVETANYRDGQLHGTLRRCDSAGKLEREETYDHSVHHGPFDHRLAGKLCVQGAFEHDLPSGQWTWFPYGNDTATIRGQWREGRAEGRWEWTGPEGRPYLTAEFDDGRLVRTEPNLLHPRVIQEAINHTSVYFPGSLSLLFRPKKHGQTPMTLDALAHGVQDLLEGPYIEARINLQAVGVPGEEVAPADLLDESLLVAFAKILKSYGLGYDVRHGTLIVDRAESIAAWQDRTGVADLTLPAGSELYRQWNSQTELDVVELPFHDVVTYLSDRHSVSIDVSLLPIAGIGSIPITIRETPITIQVRGLRLREVFAQVLERAHCKVSLRSETLVIEPQ
jgi:hypothetical protein